MGQYISSTQSDPKLSLAQPLLNIKHELETKLKMIEEGKEVNISTLDEIQQNLNTEVEKLLNIIKEAHQRDTTNLIKAKTSIIEKQEQNFKQIYKDILDDQVPLSFETTSEDLVIENHISCIDINQNPKKIEILFKKYPKDLLLTILYFYNDENREKIFQRLIQFQNPYQDLLKFFIQTKFGSEPQLELLEKGKFSQTVKVFFLELMNMWKIKEENTKQILEIGQKFVEEKISLGYLILSEHSNEKEISLKYLKISAEMGNSIAQRCLGEFYLKDDQLKNENLAIEYFQKSARNYDSFGQFLLGECYENGVGVQKNKEEAMKWYILSSQQKHQSAIWKIEELKKK